MLARREDGGKLCYRLDCQLGLLGPQPVEFILWVSGPRLRKSQVTVSLLAALAALQVLGVILCPNQGNAQSSPCWNMLVRRVEKSNV